MCSSDLLAVALPVPQEVHLMEVLSLALLAHLGSTHPQRAQPTVGRVRRDNGRIQEPLVAQRVQRVQPSPPLPSRLQHKRITPTTMPITATAS